MALKHVGRVRKNQRKVVVAYRTVPGDPQSCVVVTTENFMADEHDALMKAVESDAGQSAYEFAEAMSRTSLPDGRNMLAGLHTTGKMVKMATADVEMIPDRNTSIPLNELNQQIAEQKGVSIEDLALSDGSTSNNATTSTTADSPSPEPVNTQANDDGLLSDEELAAKYRSDADRMYKEAKRLREQAEELSPSKKNTKAKSEQ
jgi:hypothetical protein